MKLIKTWEDLEKCRFSETMKNVIRQELKSLFRMADYCPDDDGYIVVIEKGDSEEEHRKLFGCPMDEIIWEGGRLETGVWIGVMLINNQFGFTIIIPGEAWLAVKLREFLAVEAEL